METIHYLLSVSACIGCFYILYLVLFRNCSAFVLNRAFLVAGLIVSFIIPSLDLSFVPPDLHMDGSRVLSTMSVEGVLFNPTERIASAAAPGLQLIALFYGIGVLICVLRLFNGVWKVIRLMRSSEISYIGSIKVFKSGIEHPFSFFNTIFLPRRDVEGVVVDHERIHVINYHWVDLLIVEIAQAVLWFNPFLIFYKRSMKVQHEYEADAGVLSSGTKIEKYLDCILQHLHPQSSRNFISTFYSQNIKQRIIMMTKSKTNPHYRLLYLLFVPLVCGLLAAFSNVPIRNNDMTSLTSIDPNELVILIDPGHGGNDAGSSNGHAKEKELALAFAKEIQLIGAKKGLRVVLTRTTDQAISLDERLSLVKQSKADLFLSIHLNYDGSDASNSGVDIMVSDKNVQFDKSSHIAEQIKNELNSLGSLKVNGVLNSNYYVLSRNAVPAALLELGYLSNASDRAYVSDPKNQKAISEKIVNAVLASVK